MKILIDARFYGLENAGLGRYTTNLVTSIAAVDHTNSYIILLRRKYFNLLNLPDNWTKVEAEVKHYTLLEQIRIPQIIHKFKPDLVHFLHFNVPVFYKGDFVVTIHDMLMHKSKGVSATTLPFFLYFFKRFGYKFVFDNAIYKSKKIIVPSLFVKNEILRNYKIEKEKTVVIYEGIANLNKSTKSQGQILRKYNLLDKYLIYTGNAYPHKNLNRAIEAVVYANKKLNIKISLAVVSSRNIFTKRLEKIIANLDASNFVNLLGFVPDSELAVLYNHSVAFLCPSLSEGFGLPALEAMSQKTLALVSDIVVFREVYRDNAIYFNPFDFTSIASCIEKAYRLAPVERKNRIDKALTFIKRYNWHDTAQETINCYKEFE